MKRFWINHQGKSMFPFIIDGDEVLIEECNHQMLEPGDVVLFYYQLTGELTLHRLMDATTTKGDWALHSERMVATSIVGRMIASKSGNVYKLNRNKKLKVLLSKKLNYDNKAVKLLKWIMLYALSIADHSKKIVLENPSLHVSAK